jgi:hypothetical protein
MIESKRVRERSFDYDSSSSDSSSSLSRIGKMRGTVFCAKFLGFENAKNTSALRNDS